MSLKNTMTTGFKLSPLAAAFMLIGQSSAVYAAEESTEKVETKGIEVIEVTSTKRVTNIMQTGQAVNAFGEDAMEELGIDGAQDLVQYSPSLIIAGSKVSIRGVGRPNTALGSDPGVGLYTDGVYNTENDVFSWCNFCDIERVEVLRGPQGTLYGRNAIGGAINLISKEPQEDFGGYVNVEAGNDGYLVTQGQVTGALTDTFSAIVTLSKKERDGLQENIAAGGSDFGDEDRTYYSGTLKADWTDNWSSSLRYLNAESKEDSSPGYITSAYDEGTGGLNRTAFVNYGITPSGFNLPGTYPGSNAINQLMGHTAENPTASDIDKIDVDTQGNLDSESTRMIFVNTVSFGDLELKYTFGDSEFDYGYLRDGDVTNAANAGINYSELLRQTTEILYQGAAAGVYLPNPFDSAFGAAGTPITIASDMTTSFSQKAEATSHELQLMSDFDGDFNFIAGLYYYNSEESSYLDFVENGFGLMQGDPIAATYGLLPPEWGLPADSGTLLLGGPGWAPGIYELTAGALGLPFEKTADGTGGYLYRGQNDLETTATAVYGQVEYKLSDDIKLTTGLRYSKDEKEGTDNVFAYSAVADTDHKVEDSWEKVTWRVQADWTIDSDSFLYAYVATGYRSGGFNLGAATAGEVDVVDPEELTAFEVGYKRSMLDNRVNLTAAAYYYDYTDLQVTTTVVEGGVGTPSFDNAAEASITGLELSLQTAVTDDLFVNATYSYNKSEYDNYNVVDSTSCAFYGTEEACAIQDLSGNQLNMAPETKFSLTATQYVELENMGLLTFTAGYSYVGEQYSRAFNLEDWDKVDSYDNIDARVSWTSPEESYVIAAFVKNAGDERNAIYKSSPSTVTRLQASEISDPISYGIQLRYNFD
jgi:iron complex outermembrane receptor protein